MYFLCVEINLHTLTLNINVPDVLAVLMIHMITDRILIHFPVLSHTNMLFAHFCVNVRLEDLISIYPQAKYFHSGAN